MSDHILDLQSRLDDSEAKKLNEAFKKRKEQIDKELSRIRKLLLDKSVTEVSVDIHIKFDKSNISSIWSHRSSTGSELSFDEQVKRELK